MGGGQAKSRSNGAGEAAAGGASKMPTLAARTTIAAVRVDAQNRALKEELKRKDAALVSALAGLERKDKDLATALAQHLTHEEFAHMQEEARRVVAEETRAQAAGHLPARWHDPDAFARAIEAELKTEKNFLMLVAGLYYHLERKDVVAAALAALWPPLALGNDDNRLPAFHANAVPATKAAMDKHWSERAVMLPACKVLQHITSGSMPEDAAICTNVGEHDGIGALSTTLDAFETDPEIVSAVLAALVNLIPDNKAAVIAASNIERICELLQRFPDNVILHKHAITALHDLLAGPDAQERLTALGVETQVLAAMARSDALPGTKDTGQKLLSKLPKASCDTERETAALKLAEQGNYRAYVQFLREQAKKKQGERRWWGGHDEAPWVAVAAQQQEPATRSPEDKFVATKLILGASEIAAGGLDKATGMTDEVKAAYLRDPAAVIEMEVLLHGSKQDCDNFYYIRNGVAQNWDDYPDQVQEDIRSGTYHGGSLGPDDYDAGHAGKKLEDFVNHPTSKLAGLKLHHVLVLRLYTSSSFRRFNGPLRRGENPHPWKCCLYVLTQALKMLRVVDATLHPQDFNQVKFLYRGMQNMEVDAEQIKTVGGTELAPMSATNDRSVALAYANSQCPLVFVFKTIGLSRGVCIQYLSLYPNEVEYLYPPLTFLSAEGSGVQGSELEQGTRVRISTSDTRYNGREGVVLSPRHAQGRVRVELMCQPRKQLIVKRDHLQVLCGSVQDGVIFLEVTPQMS